ncbi:MAG: bifunctional riboflavin kinase/FAD synthetase [Deltaproteobacteria bacterium]|nr:bifunctional riboflavin kinase/FAD synthetase [Deltaproteobacteria bacterium]
MQIVYDLNELTGPLRNPVLTIGNFDGVHRGHLALFDKVMERAKAINGQSVVLTFDPHPIKVMSPGNGPPLITPIEQKLKLISNTGIDVIICLAFTLEFASMSAEDFVHDILMDRLGVREIVVGYDYTFGYKRQGDVSLLREMGDKLGFRVHVTDPIHLDDAVVSSTSIRKFIQQGNLVAAKKLLGRDYQIYGTVVKGKGRGGRLLGFPTANLKPVDELIPKKGVYAVTVRVDDKDYCGVANIGYNPTFGDDALSIEAHLLDFSENIVGKMIEIKFIQRIRDEKTFRDVKELSDRITQDIEQARTLKQTLFKGLKT